LKPSLISVAFQKSVGFLVVGCCLSNIVPQLEFNMHKELDIENLYFFSKQIYLTFSLSTSITLGIQRYGFTQNTWKAWR